MTEENKIAYDKKAIVNQGGGAGALTASYGVDGIWACHYMGQPLLKVCYEI